jgi:hypothetical protein
MNHASKQVIAIALIAAILVIAYVGEYLPLRKAQIFLSTLSGLQSTPPSSLADLETRISIPLDYASMIGQEELVRNTANSVLSFVQQSPDATTTTQLVDYIMSYYNPILSRGSGMSFGQDLYLVGVINEIAFAQTGKPNFLGAAQEYYEEGVAKGPNRPQALYGLFDVYRTEGNVASTTAIVNRIMTNWPTDQSIPQTFAAFLLSASSSQKGN